MNTKNSSLLINLIERALLDFFDAVDRYLVLQLLAGVLMAAYDEGLEDIGKGYVVIDAEGVRQGRIDDLRLLYASAVDGSLATLVAQGTVWVPGHVACVVNPTTLFVVPAKF